MAEIKVLRQSGYTVMSNHHLRDRALGLKAKGLLSVILSLPDDWDYSIRGLAKICGCGREAIGSALAELEQAGYVSRERIRNEDGTLAGTEYTIRETPQQDAQADQAQPVPGNPAQGNPAQEKPVLENPPQINTKGTKKRKEQNTCANAQDDAFDRFWAAYPRKVDKKKARAAFGRVKAPVEILLAALERQKQTEAWTKEGGRFVPHPTTWLNGERWEDEMGQNAPPAPDPGGGSTVEEWT